MQLEKNREVFYNCPAVQLLAGNDESGGSGPMQYLAEVILKCLKLTAYNNRINAAMSAYKRATSPFDVKVDD